MRKVRAKLLFATIVALATTANPQSLEQKRIDGYIRAYRGVIGFSGVVLISSNDTILFHKAYGMADYEWNIPNTLQTKFQIGSLSKAFTAVLVLQMAEQGRLQLDDKITKYLPEFHIPKGDSITVCQLLCHTSGIPHYDAIPDYDPKYTRTPLTSLEYVDVISNLELLFRPGTRYSYSSFGYSLLGFMLESISGLSFPELLKKNILIPCGMMDTAFNDLYTLQEYRASGYNFDQAGLMNCRFEDTYKSIGCGGLISTVKDLYLWNRALDSNRLLSEGFRKLLFKSNLNSYGFGWMLREVVSKESHDTLSVAFHGGSDFGFAGFISKNLTNGTCIVVLSNLETAPINKISEDISRMLLGEDIQPPVARQAISVDKSIYSNCAGKYQISADYGITIFEEKHGLSIQWTGLPMRLLLFPASESTYFLRESDKEFTFERNVEGGIAGLSFKDREGTITAKKVP